MKDTRTIFYGTSEFGLPTLEWLHANTSLIAVVTTPDKPVGRKQELLGSPVKQWLADKDGIILLQPHSLKNQYLEQALRHLSAEVAILASYGKIVPKTILEIPAKHTLNLHPSLLPKYRGATPIQSALMSGDSVTGTTLMLMDEELDHGPILAQVEMSIGPDDNYETMHEKLSLASRDLLIENFDKYLNGQLTPHEQDHKSAIDTFLLSKEDGLIDWRLPAEEITRKVRAYNPWPGTYAKLAGGQVLKIFKVAAGDIAALQPGQTKIENKRLFVGTATTPLEILELQAAGAKRLNTEQYLAGLREEIHFGF